MSAARLVSWGLALAAAAALAQEPSPADYRAQLARARAVAAEGRFAEAGALLDAAVQRYPEDFTLRLEAAFAWLRAERWLEAEREYRAALALNEDAFEARLGLADALAGQRRWAEVREVTAALLAGRDEPGLHTRHALAHFWLGDLATAQRHSARALALRPGDADARLGLAWVAQRRGEVAAARAGFEQVQANAAAPPRSRASAEEGLAALGPRHRVGAALHAVGQGTGTQLAGGPLVTVDALLEDAWLVAGRYRLLSAPVTRASAGWTQHEGWLRLGWRSPGASVTLHGALLGLDARGGGQAPASELAWLLGVSGRVRAFADWVGSAVVSRSPAQSVVQGELGGRLGLAPWLSVSLGARAQWVEGSGRLAAVGLVQARGARWLVGLGGTYGPTVRPVELDVAALYLVSDELRWRAAARAAVGLTPRWWLAASYDLEAYLDAGADDRLLHRVSLGISFVP